MTDWYVLGLDRDPAPGDPIGVRTLAARAQAQADLVDGETQRLRSIAAGDGDLAMQGDFAAGFTGMLRELPAQLAKLGRGYHGCAAALSGYAGELEGAQTRAAAALRSGRDADDRFNGALAQIRSLVPPDRQALFQSGLSVNELAVETATLGLDEGLRAQIRSVAARARYADGDRDRARRLALEAAQLRGDAEARCDDGIRHALSDSGLKNKEWWQKAGDWFHDRFSSWDNFVETCKWVGLALGVVAMFISGPIGLALMAIALAANAVMFADTFAKAVQGKASWWDVGFAALALIPMGSGVMKFSTLWKQSAEFGAALLRGEGKALFVNGLRTFGGDIAQNARNMWTAFGHAREIAGGIHSMEDLSLFARAFKCRWIGRDPIDMATGEMVMQMTDLTLPGVLPLVLQRTYVSRYTVGGWFGRGWSSVLDQRLELDAQGICFASTEGVLLAFDRPTLGGTVRSARGPRYRLTHRVPGPDAAAGDPGRYVVEDPQSGRTLHFAPPPAELGDLPPGRAIVLPLTAIEDRNGNRIEFEYHPQDGGLALIRHGGGYVLDVDSRDGLVRGIRLRGASEAEDVTLIRYGYDATGRLTEIVNSSGRPLRFSYDQHDRMVRWEDRNGTWYQYTYDEQGRAVRTSGSAGCLDGVMRYDEDNRVTYETNSLGHTTSYHFNADWQMERVVDPLGGVTVQQWDAFNRLLAQTDPLGRTTRYRYDEADDLVEVTRPDGSAVHTEYDRLHWPVRIIAPDGATWLPEHDERGNLVAVTDPAGAVSRHAYDEHGRLTAVTDALGWTTQVHCDGAGLPAVVTDPLGNPTRYQRDGLGRVTALTDPLGNTTRFSWTVEGQLSGRTLPDGAAEHWTYDAEGNLVEHVDALGQTTRTEITHFDLPAARTTPDGARIAFAYDTELRLVAVTNPQGLVWRYDHDPAGNLVRETDFNGRALTYQYDAAGQLIGRVNGAGEQTRYFRDVVGNVVEQEAAGGTTRFAYDPAGRLIRATNPDTDLQFERDPLGRVLSESWDGRAVGSTYDAVGRRVERRTPSGAVSRWEFDVAGRPATLHAGGQAIRFAHDAAGREVERRLPSGLALAQQWDAASRRASLAVTVTDRPLLHRRYAYRADGYLAQLDDAATGTRSFALDAVGRVTAVTGVTGEDWTERYAYDPAGNITDAQWPVPAAPTTSDAQGGREYTGTLIRRAGNVRYSYDAQGRVTLRQQRMLSTKDRTWHYSWDAEDRLVAVTTPDGQRWRYRHDALGRRVAKLRLGDDGVGVVERVEFAWDGPVLAEQTVTDFWPGGPRSGPPGDEPTVDPAAGSRTTTWDWEPESFRPVAQTDRVPGDPFVPGDPSAVDAPQEWIDEQFYAIVTDLVGTPTELLDPGGDIAWRSWASLWGASTDAESLCPLRFPGQYADPETGLHYNVFRYYDPGTGAYGSDDPLRLAGGINPRLYVTDTRRFIDPLGLFACDVLAGADDELVRVGRWMSKDEHELMCSTKLVQEGAGGTTYVAYPADVMSYMSQARSGSRYVEFDVPLSSLAPAGKVGWAQIPGPNSLRARLAQLRGLPVPQFPQALNIDWLASKL
jgi:RHS repeat-associated protein